MHLLSVEQLILNYLIGSFRVRNSGALHRTFNVEPLYLQHENSGLAVDFMVGSLTSSVSFKNTIYIDLFYSTGKFR